MGQWLSHIVPMVGYDLAVEYSRARECCGMKLPDSKIRYRD